MGAVVQFAVNLEEFECSECGAVYALAQNFVVSRRGAKEGLSKSWYCPNGHGQSFTKSEAAELRAKLVQEEQARKLAEEARDRAREERDAAQRAARAERTKHRRLRERVSKGVCPCCHRTVSQLARHMETKHPDYTKTPTKAAE